MLDREGFRPNVGIVLLNARNEVFWGKRLREHSWQFPQGGIDADEAPETALFRELDEEIGTSAVSILGQHPEWLSYDLPPHLIGRALGGRYRGQTQAWFVVRFEGDDRDIRLDAHLPAEFDAWAWVPLADVQRYDLGFKRALYARLAEDFADIIRPA